MTVILGSDAAGETLKDIIKEHSLANDYNVNDVTDVTKDFVDNALAVATGVNAAEGNLGIMIGAYDAGNFMIAAKVKGTVAAGVSDERSAYMTRTHSDTRMITMGVEIVGVELAKNIAKGFLEGHYDGGRYQIRVDMLNKVYWERGR